MNNEEIIKELNEKYNCAKTAYVFIVDNNTHKSFTCQDIIEVPCKWDSNDIYDYLFSEGYKGQFGGIMSNLKVVSCASKRTTLEEKLCDEYEERLRRDEIAREEAEVYNEIYKS
jgi:hypothetical protein